MQRGVLAPTVKHVSGDRDSNGSSHHLADLKAQLADAERELRHCRKERLNLEMNLREAEQASRVTVDDFQNPPTLPKEAVEALASHQDPPEVLHCLAEVLVLVVDAPLLVDMGEHPLPGRMPWKNLKSLLHKSWEKHDAMACATALQREPFGVRLRQHARKRLLGSAVVEREAVAALDDGCLPVLDFLFALLKPPRSTGESRSQATPAKRDLEVSAAQRQRLLEAVVAHEQNVALIRKKLQEAKRSEDNASTFAAKHAPCVASSDSDDQSCRARNNAIQVVTPTDGCKASVQRDALAAGGGSSRCNETAQANGGRMTGCGYPAIATSAGPTLAASRAGADTRMIADGCGAAGVGSYDAAQQHFAASRQSIQYRLNEVSVPQLQETVLASLASALMEQRGGRDRVLEISGFSDAREELETGWQRSLAVVEFLESRGVPSERLRLVTESVPPSARGSQGSVARSSTRRVDLVLFDGGGSADKSVRQRANEVFSRILNSKVATFPKQNENDEATRAHRQLPNANIVAGSERGASVAEQVAKSVHHVVHSNSPVASDGLENKQDTSNRLPAPAVFIEEVPVSSEGNCTIRSLRIVFALPGLSASDTSLDVGHEAVRLRSVSGAWPDVEAALPFLVQPPTERAAHFSRKNGTLTLHLTSRPTNKP